MTSEVLWEIPEPLAMCEVRLGDDAVTTLRRHGNPSGPRLIMSHGNGFAIDLYYPFWSQLTDDFDLIIYDLRNHGWNAVGDRKQHNIPNLISDQDRILESIDFHYGRKPNIGIFHSLSTLIALLASTAPILVPMPVQNRGFSAMVLFDPPLRKAGIDRVEFDEVALRTAGMARRRGHQFRTREEFSELLHCLPTFSRVLPGVPELMAATILRKSEAGEGYELRCPRDYEAQIIEWTGSYSMLVDFDALPCPAKVIGADPTLPYSYLPSYALDDIMTVDYDFIPEATHLLQLEKPEECAAAIREFIERHDLM